MSIRRIMNGFKTVPLLDLYDIPSNSGLGAAWSLRKLRTAYSGPCIKARRSSDNATLDIGFLNNILNIDQLLSFGGNGNVYVEIWYDQSGNTQHLRQNELLRQPQIVKSGNIILEHGKPALSFDGINDYFEVPGPNSTNYFRALHCEQALVTLVARVGYDDNPNIACGFVDTGGALGSQMGYSFFFDSRIQFERTKTLISIASTGSSAAATLQAINNIMTVQNQFIIINSLDISNVQFNQRSRLYKNNVEYITNQLKNTPNNSNSTRTLKVGACHTVNIINYHLGTMQELVIYLSDKSIIKHNVRSNINSYYNIY